MIRNQRIAARVLLLLILAFFIAIFSGCYTKKQALAKFCKPELRIKDSLRITNKTITTTHDSAVVVIIPGTKNEVSTSSPCDSLGRVKDFKLTAGSGKNSLTLEGKNGVLTGTCNCDSAVNIYKERERMAIHERDSIATNKTTEVKIVEKELKLWQKVALYLWTLEIAGALAIFYAIYVVWKKFKQ